MVSLPSLNRFLQNHNRIGLDSNILIYFIEGAPVYEKPIRQIFEAIKTDRNSGICSVLTLLEVLVQPYRENNEELVNKFYGLLTTFPNLSWVGMDVKIADLGAQLRAKYKLKTPDAILLATAIQAGATGFIGNDAQMKKVKELEILLLTQ